MPEDVLPEVEFVGQVADAYEHLYDPVYFRTHPLTDVLIPDPSLRRKEKAWQLHRILVGVIEELDPGPQAPVFSHEWRRHRLMVLHYLDGLDPQTVADQLAISRRHYYREHESAIEAVASILWSRYVVRPSVSQPVSQAAGAEASPSRLELLRLEAARMAQSNRYARVGDVVPGVLSLLQEMLRQHGLDIHLALPETLPGVPIDQGLLRQVLLGILGYLIEHAEGAIIWLAAQVEGSAVRLSLTVEPPSAIHPTPPTETQERLAVFEEMATLSGIHILPVRAGQVVVGFEMQLPAGSQRTVLVVDDNEDVLQLFQRYLSPHDYRVVTAQTARDTLALAHQLRPHAITLDLMMPDQDGWDLLQVLLNQPDTHHIPIIVCSVLKQKELALLLGATAFLEKPVTEQALLSALAALEKT